MKIFITDNTFAPSIDGPALLEANEVVDVEVDTGHALVQAGKGLYVEPKDDRSKTKGKVVSKERLQEVAAAHKAAAKQSAKAASEPAAA